MVRFRKFYVSILLLFFCGFVHSSDANKELIKRLEYVIDGDVIKAKDTFKKAIKIDKFQVYANHSLKLLSDYNNKVIKKATTISLFKALLNNEKKISTGLIGY